MTRSTLPVPIVLYATLSRQLRSPELASYLRLLPAWKRERIGKFRRWQDAQSSLFGLLLLLEGLKRLDCPHLGLHQVKLSPFNRPYFDEGPDFNISHSGDYVLCALAPSGRVGIDIEQIRPIELSDFDHLFRGEERLEMARSASPLDSFYDFWTRKEAVVKADGQGLSLELASVRLGPAEALVGDKKWHLRPIRLDDAYKIHLAADAETGDVVPERIVF